MVCRRTALAVILALAAVAGAPPRALAVLSLSTGAAPVFTDNLDLGEQTQTYTLPMTAKDTSNGSSPGWHLTITSTQFATAGPPVRNLPDGSSSVSAVSSSCAQGNCVAPVNSVVYPLAIPAAGTAPAAVKFYDAAANTGQGMFTVTATVRVAVPSNSFAGTYTSTLTLAIASGP